jgi:hypothetical protein
MHMVSKGTTAALDLAAGQLVTSERGSCGGPLAFKSVYFCQYCILAVIGLCQITIIVVSKGSACRLFAYACSTAHPARKCLQHSPPSEDLSTGHTMVVL